MFSKFQFGVWSFSSMFPATVVNQMHGFLWRFVFKGWERETAFDRQRPAFASRLLRLEHDLQHLKRVMHERHVITREDVARIARETGEPEAAVYGVATYYGDLGTERRRPASGSCRTCRKLPTRASDTAASQNRW